MNACKHSGMAKSILLVLVLFMSGCLAPARVGETSLPQPTRTSTDRPSEATPDIMIEPTATFSITQVDTNTVPVAPSARTGRCPHLESNLLGLVESEDPKAFAQSHSLFYTDGFTRVAIELVVPGADSSFLVEYDGQIESQAESLVQALVPLKNLCALSNDPKVKFVRAPRKPVLP